MQVICFPSENLIEYELKAKEHWNILPAIHTVRYSCVAVIVPLILTQAPAGEQTNEL